MDFIELPSSLKFSPTADLNFPPNVITGDLMTSAISGKIRTPKGHRPCRRTGGKQRLNGGNSDLARKRETPEADDYHFCWWRHGAEPKNKSGAKLRLPNIPFLEWFWPSKHINDTTKTRVQINVLKLRAYYESCGKKGGSLGLASQGSHWLERGDESTHHSAIWRMRLTDPRLVSGAWVLSTGLSRQQVPSMGFGPLEIRVLRFLLSHTLTPFLTKSQACWSHIAILSCPARLRLALLRQARRENRRRRYRVKESMAPTARSLRKWALTWQHSAPTDPRPWANS